MNAKAPHFPGSVNVNELFEDKVAASSHRTKVLLLTDSFLPHAGGSREYYYNIYRNLVDLGRSEVTILTKKVPGWEEFDESNSSIIFRIERWLKPLSSWKYRQLPKGIGAFLHALKHVVRHTPDVVHAGDLYPQGLTAMILKRFLGLPYAVYCHGEEITQTDRFRYQPRVRDQIYKNADAVIANSEFARQNLWRIGVVPGRIFKITPGVNATRFRSNAANGDLIRQHGLEGKNVIVTVARLVPRKGHYVALQAFANICNEFPKAHYLIVGTGPEERNLKQLSHDLGLTNRVTFTGFVKAGDLAGYYNLCDVMLLANRQEVSGDIEGFGITFLEANAAGKAVIGGRSGGAVEAIVDGTTGLLVDPEDVSEVAQALKRLLSDPEYRAQLGAAGARRVNSDFKWEERAQMLEDVNKKMCALKQSAISGCERCLNPSQQAKS